MPSFSTIKRVRARWARTGGAEPRARRWRARNWTEQEINLAKKFVCKVHPSGWRQYQLRRHLCVQSARHVLRPLCAISRLVRKVMRCTPKRTTNVASQQDPIKVATYWQNLSDESGLTEQDLHVPGGWCPPGQRVRVERPLQGKGMRTECIAAICTDGLLAVRFLSKGTVQWRNFRRVVIRYILPKMNLWPLPRSVLVRLSCLHLL